jgi:hypothetical protein
MVFIEAYLNGEIKKNKSLLWLHPAQGQETPSFLMNID